MTKSLNKDFKLPKGICYLCFPKNKTKIKSIPVSRVKQALVPKILQNKLK